MAHLLSHADAVRIFSIKRRAILGGPVSNEDKQWVLDTLKHTLDPTLIPTRVIYIARTAGFNVSRMPAT